MRSVRLLPLLAATLVPLACGIPPDEDLDPARAGLVLEGPSLLPGTGASVLKASSLRKVRRKDFGGVAPLDVPVAPDAPDAGPGQDPGPEPQPEPEPDVSEPEPAPDVAEPAPDAPDAAPDAPPPPAAALALRLAGATSSSVTLEWDAVPGAREVRVALGAEPPAAPGAPLAAEVELEVLPGDATRVVLPGLAPAADHFLRVRALSDGGEVAAVLHARTPGGPRAPLDSPVREVHGIAPRILQVVLANGSGAAWQAGPWEVARRDGTPLAVLKASRHSLPVGAPSYVVGWGKPYSDTVIDADHRVFLHLDQPLGGPDVLRVRGPGVDFLLPFSDRYLETPSVQLNQVGYNPRATRRYAYVSGWLGDGGALPLDDFPGTVDVLAAPDDAMQPRPAVRAGLSLSLRKAADKAAGADVREVDLASVPADEAVPYRVRVPGVGVSWRTEVSERAAFRAFYVVVRGLFLNRWGGDLRADLTDFARPVDHPTVYTSEGTDFDAKFATTTPKDAPRPLAGGYHDAGDFDQRPMHTVVPQLLMRAYEMSPARFADGQQRIPESGNGIPDLLDEALWGVKAWEALQEADGGVRMGVESTRHPWGFYLASDDPLVYWTYSRDPGTSARAAGLFAQAARLVAPFDAARSSALRDRAVRAFAFAKANGAPASFRLYGAGELFRLTGDAAYRADFDAAWAAMGPYGAFSNLAENHLFMSDYRAGGQAMPDYILAYAGAPGATATVPSTARTWLTNLAKNHLSTLDNSHGHRSPRPSTYPATWGQFVGSARYMDTLVARMALGDLTADQRRPYFDALSLAADFALGANPDGLSYFTGLGSRRPEEPLHLDSLAFVKTGKGVMPGIPVYGPVDSLNSATYQAPAKAAFHPTFDQHPLGRRFADVRTVVQCSEFTVWELQAPFAQLFALLLGDGAGTDLLPAGATVDGIL